MAEGVKNGVGDYARFVTRTENANLVLALECLRGLIKARGHLRKWSPRRDLCNDLSNLAARTRTRELNDPDESNNAKNDEGVYRKYVAY